MRNFLAIIAGVAVVLVVLGGLAGVKTMQIADVSSTRRWKRYQTVAGIFRSCFSGASFRSIRTRDRLLSRKSRSAAFKASSAARDRTHSSRDKTRSSIRATSSESLPSTSATISFRRAAWERISRASVALPEHLFAPLNSARVPLGSPPRSGLSICASPVGQQRVSAGRGRAQGKCASGNFSASNWRNWMILAGIIAFYILYTRFNRASFSRRVGQRQSNPSKTPNLRRQRSFNHRTSSLAELVITFSGAWRTASWTGFVPR